MNRTSLLTAMMVVLSGCQNMGPEKAGGIQSIYRGDNSVLYQVQTQLDSPDQAMRFAARSYQAGDLDQALFQYLRVIELDPKRYEALVWVGRIHRERGNHQLAEMAFMDVLASDPDNLGALGEMGLLQLAVRNQEKAREYLQRAVGEDQRRLGGDPKVSLADAAGIRVDGDSPVRVYNGLGVLSDLREDFPAAEAFYRLAMQIEPRSPLVQNSLGYSYYLAGHWVEAESAYKRGIGYEPGYQPLWRNYGLLLARMGRYEEAISAFEQVEKRAEASNDVGYICLVEGKLDEAEQFFRSAIEQSPAHYETAWENLNRVQQIRRLRGLGGRTVVAEPVAAVPGTEVFPVALP
ncbi:Tfp pilus assembly protein PilF [Pseudomonas sp. A46]|uniref:tetratricopeptide repeat protein n=1 Tax=Metapseudomonas furukawaii TaxID=1149133 RepID=UPI000B49A34D|nr:MULTISPECIES: tetratricopeptide repeat protein [Pseudomonas]OWJ92390.1 Tfp pilus assembly protein PilF [Pseudomonas sp. A46]WAG77303.1 tetratricopeptide repeat protein [Pseudomonas furukawaii]